MKLSAIRILIYIFHQLLFVHGDGTIILQLLSIRVHELKRVCDPGIINSHCDLYLKICMGTNNTRCSLARTDTPRDAYPDQNYIEFGDTIGHQRNPIEVHVKSVPEVIHLEITVMDSDHGIFDPDDNLVTWRSDISLEPEISESAAMSLLESYSYPEVPVQKLTKPVRNGGIVRFNFKLRARCKDGWFGKRCDVNCSPQHNNRTGHFGCDSITGNKVCIPGWYGDNCNALNTCEVERPCGPMGRCVNTNDGFQCICYHSFSGPLCLQPPSHCDQQYLGGKAPATFCRNRGVCVLRSGGLEVNHSSVHSTDLSPQCACQPGFSGAHCEHDVDECAGWQHHHRLPSHTQFSCPLAGFENAPCCGANSTCINTYGSYKCSCPHGWAGPICQLPPTVWPMGYRPLVPSLNLDDRHPPPDDNLTLPINSASISKSAGGTQTWVYFLVVFFLLQVVLLVVGGIYYFRYRQRNKLPFLPQPRGIGRDTQAVVYRPSEPIQVCCTDNFSKNSNLPLGYRKNTFPPRGSGFRGCNETGMHTLPYPMSHALVPYSGRDLAVYESMPQDGEAEQESDYEELPPTGMQAEKLANEAAALAVASQQCAGATHTLDHSEEVWKRRDTETSSFAHTRLLPPKPSKPPKDSNVTEFDNMIYLEPNKLPRSPLPLLPPRSSHTRLS